MELLLTRHICFVITMYCVMLPTCVKTQSTVRFTAQNSIVVAGQKVDFLCATNSFDQTQDEVQIYFGTEVLLHFSQGTSVFYGTADRTDDYYKTDVFRSESGTGFVGIGLHINKVQEVDSGQYKCIMTLSGVQKISESIDLIVQHIAKPTCIVPSTLGITQNGSNISVLDGYNLNLICRVDLDSNGMPVILEWSRSDSGVFFSTGNNETPVASSSVSVPMSTHDDGVTFTCMSKTTEPLYNGLAEICQINVRITGRVYTPSTFVAMAPENLAPNSTALFVAIGILIGLLVLLLIIIAVFCIVRSKTISGYNTDQNEIENPYSSQITSEHADNNYTETSQYSSRIQALYEDNTRL